MATSFLLDVDLTAPQAVTLTLNSGNARTGVVDITAAITSSSGDASQVKIYGDVDDTAAPLLYRATEANAPWVPLASPHSIRVAAGDGAKTVRVKVRDDVGNTSGEVTATITLDTTAPTPNITSGPTAARVSAQAGFDSTSFVLAAGSEDIQAWKIKVVTSQSDLHTAGAQIGTANGSTNASGGALTAGQTVTVTLKTADILAASAGGGSKRIKAFVQDLGGLWSSV